MFEALGLLLRLPFFFIGLILWTIVGFPLWILVIVLGIARLPFQFLDASWNKNKGQWEDAKNDFTEESSTYFLRPYQELYRWLLGS
jgi:hypothetical protein